ncbi:hypothetical protein [Actinacidiphila yeochonensis]|uniref:hypothetical protein n=1 Tax=Actinacidiphila yeochonensis TaxID=89050 RepID=UPI00056AE981|nr:hypothetical protein [Actinacidiphila yeochonensis]
MCELGKRPSARDVLIEEPLSVDRVVAAASSLQRDPVFPGETGDGLPRDAQAVSDGLRGLALVEVSAPQFLFGDATDGVADSSQGTGLRRCERLGLRGVLFQREEHGLDADAQRHGCSTSRAAASSDQAVQALDFDAVSVVSR